MYKENRHNIGYARYTCGIYRARHTCTYSPEKLFIFSAIYSKCCFQVHSFASIIKTKDKVNRVSLRAVNAFLKNKNLDGYLALITD